MLALALNLGSSAWPEIIKPHPYWVIGLGILGLLFLMSPWLRRALVRAQGRLYKEDAPADSPIISVSSEAPIRNEVTASPTISPVFAPVFNVSPVISTTIPPNQSNTQIPTPAPVEKPAPRLRMSLESMSVIYRLEHSAWGEATQFDHDSREAIVAWFANPVPSRGMSGVDASQLSAHIEFSVAGHWSTQVSRGYWLGYSANEIRINIADRAGLILGLADWSHWVSYSNPYARPANEEFLQPAMWLPGEKVQMPKADMDIEVSLLSKNMLTVDQQKIHLCFTNGKPYAVRYP